MEREISEELETPFRVGGKPVAIDRLDDGTLVLTREIRPGDEHFLRQGLERMSDRSRYYRFLRPVHELAPRELRYLTDIDGHHHWALGVLVPTADGSRLSESEVEPVAVGRFVRLEDDPRAADVALTVVDGWQRRGIGKMLLRRLAAAAREREVDRFVLDVLAENRGMRALIQSVADDPPVEREREVLTYELALDRLRFDSDPAEDTDQPGSG